MKELGQEGVAGGGGSLLGRARRGEGGGARPGKELAREEVEDFAGEGGGGARPDQLEVRDTVVGFGAKNEEKKLYPTDQYWIQHVA